MDVGNLAGAAVFITVRAQNPGVITNTATVTADDAEPNSATVETMVEPQIPEPEVADPNLMVTTVVSGVTTPTGIAFLGDNDFLVLEQFTGQVKRVVDGAVQSIVLDLGVNFFSERGLLSIALHPDFDPNRRSFVYLYWTCRSSMRLGPCEGLESSTDSGVPAEVPLLGNRVDRFIWDGDSANPSLTFDMNLIQLRALQEDANQPPRGNHNGGKIRFGPDGRLYIYMGDNGRRGWMQNITTGVGPDGDDDQFGGPEPDDAHLTGFVLRLNDDGSTPEDNPFFNVQASDLPEDLQPRATPEVIANIQKVFAYGIRNGFGLAFDPVTGQLWESQNGDDSGSEINRIEAGFNGGWVQIMGRLGNIATYKAIETSPVYFGLQQVRWPPTLIADTPEEAEDRLFKLPGSQYTDPLLTWKFEVAPAGFGFIQGPGLGPEFDGDLVIGGARNFLFDGHLYRFKLTPDRMDLDLSSDEELNGTRVIENIDKWDITGSENFLFGKGFGLTTDIQTGPNGNLFVVSLGNNAVYEIQRRP
jgi:glucose/arabinose dehydrogenase